MQTYTLLLKHHLDLDLAHPEIIQNWILTTENAPARALRDLDLDLGHPERIQNWILSTQAWPREPLAFPFLRFHLILVELVRRDFAVPELGRYYYLVLNPRTPQSPGLQEP